LNDSQIPREIVLLIHGIRTEAVWEDLVAHELREISGLTVLPISYGYFDTFRFWFPFFTRVGPLRRIQREIRAVGDSYPGVPISVIAHSFGTYAIASVLDDNPDIRLKRLILCGSIIPRTFRWDKIRRRQLGYPVINDCGERDIWPCLAQGASFGYGASGTLGFGSVDVVDRYHPFTHSEFFHRAFVDSYWTPLISGGEVVFPSRPRVGTKWWLSTLSRMPLQWGFLVTMICLLTALAVRGLLPISPTVPQTRVGERSAARILETLSKPVYVGFDRSDIGLDYSALLDAKAEILKANPRIRIRLEGNTTTHGSDEYLLGMGQREAGSAKRYFVNNGIDQERFEMVSYGDEHAITPAPADTVRWTRFRWDPNRRVEFVASAKSPSELVDPNSGSQVARVRASKKTLRLTEGERAAVYGLAYTSQNAAITSARIRYWSNDPNVATIDNSGIVTGVGPGRTRLDMSAEGVTDTVSVSVRRETLIFDPNSSQPEFIASSPNCKPIRDDADHAGVVYRLSSQSDQQRCSAIVAGAGTVDGSVRLEWDVGETGWGDATGQLGLAFGVNNAGTSFWYVSVHGGPEGLMIALYRHALTGDELLVPWQTFGGPADVIDVDIIGPTITVYANDSETFEYPALAPITGHIGIVARGKPVDAGIRFLVFRILQ
jgi:outer membrane protein OmpA-like peptidoglycan-associated protein/pimeloyl-ACP methyl ester carboxylesterase